MEDINSVPMIFWGLESAGVDGWDALDQLQRKPSLNANKEYEMSGLFGSLRKMFGGAAATPKAAEKPETYKGYEIFAEPMAEGGQYRLAGRIVKGEGEEAKEHKLVRADLFANKDDVIAATIRKAHQVIDEQGDGIFG